MTGMDYRQVQVYVVHKTDSAMLIRTDDSRETWVPLSQLDQDEDVPEVGDSAVVHVAEWLADRESLESVDDGSVHALLRRPKPQKRRVHHPKLGDSVEIAVEGDKSVVMFGTDKRTILTRFLVSGHKG